VRDKVELMASLDAVMEKWDGCAATSVPYVRCAVRLEGGCTSWLLEGFRIYYLGSTIRSQYWNRNLKKHVALSACLFNALHDIEK
jgi:hypothetical protein